MIRRTRRSDTDTEEDDSQLYAKVEQLTDAVHELAGQVEVLRSALDEFTSQFTWAIRNDKLAYRPDEWMVRLHSMPADPTAPDWAERVQIDSVKVQPGITDIDRPKTTIDGNRTATDGRLIETSQDDDLDKSNDSPDTEPNSGKQTCLW